MKTTSAQLNTFGIMDCPAQELPGILRSFLDTIEEYKKQSEGKPELLSELCDAYDEIDKHLRRIDFVTNGVRNQIRMTMRHIYKLVVVDLIIQNTMKTEIPQDQMNLNDSELSNIAQGFSMLFGVSEHDLCLIFLQVKLKNKLHRQELLQLISNGVPASCFLVNTNDYDFEAFKDEIRKIADQLGITY